MIYSFTGPSDLTPVQEAYCLKELRQIHSGELDTWRSGAAFGLDTLVVECANSDEDVELYIPSGEWYNASLLDKFDFMTVLEIEGGYRRRNEALVRGSDVLHAFLRRGTFYRSGEWMTVNIAANLGVPVQKHLLPA